MSTDDHPINLAGMTVQFVSAHSATSLSDSSGVASAHAIGVFFIVTLRITNASNQPETVESVGGSDQFALSAIGKPADYSESFDAENGADQQSFIAQNSTPVQPGESQTGDVVFDIPPSALAQIETHGAALIFGAWGTDLSSATTTKKSPAALLLIRHASVQG